MEKNPFFPIFGQNEPKNVLFFIFPKILLIFLKGNMEILKKSQLEILVIHDLLLQFPCSAKFFFNYGQK